MSARDAGKRPRVLRKARPAIARTGLQEGWADPRIHSDRSRNVGDVSAEAFAKVGDFVDERDLHCKKAVGGRFDEFGVCTAGHDERHATKNERTVKQPQHALCAFILDFDDNTIRVEEIVDSRSFAKKLGIGGNREFRMRAFLGDDIANGGGRADGHC